MYACISDIGGGFFEGVCRQKNRLLTRQDSPLPLDSRIDCERRALATPLVWIYARLWKRPSEKPLLALRYVRARCWTLQLRQTLHCALRLLSVGGGGGCLRWCVSRPRSYSNRKRLHSASVFAEQLLAPPDSLGESHGQPSEIAHSLRRNLGMSGVDRLLVSLLCPIVLFPLLKEHT
jgi:hypothetical protein